MGEICQKRKTNLILLLILYGTADVWSSLPVDLTSEEKGKRNQTAHNIPTLYEIH